MISLKTLNKEQKRAVEYDGGPLMVVAGPGSGKTRVITYKVAWLIDQKYDPSSILVLTFTNKAASEIRERLVELVGEKANQIWAGTFHSIFSRILRTEGVAIGYTPHFSIYDREDSYALVRSCVQALELDDDDANSKQWRNKISYLKNLMIFPQDLKKKSYKGYQDENFIKVFELYQKKLALNDAMDFEDLLIKPLELFKNDKILLKYKKMFKYILIDEFQDTNKAQYEIARMLLTRDQKICVVGDDAQSIYSWRGAEMKNMLNFTNDFPKTQIVRLEQNYRSTPTIIKAADAIIRNNANQIDKNLWTKNEDGDKIALVKCSDEKDEAYHIAKFLQDEIELNKYSFKDFAVLYRTNAQSRALEDVFREENIQYKIIGGIEFYLRKEVKDILAYLKVLVNRKDEESLLRIMNFPQRGIGQTTINRMLNFAAKHDITLYETMSRVFEVIEIKERIQKHVRSFRQLLDKYILLKNQLSITELTKTLIGELGVLNLFKSENSLEGVQRYENIEALMNAIAEFEMNHPGCTLEDYLQKVTLTTDHEFVQDRENYVRLMTVHNAKGLEFPVVFLSGLEEDVFPISQRFINESNLEEERRLFYVAVTRAQKKLYLTHARARYRFGEVAYQDRSRFISEIPSPIIVDTVLPPNRRANRKTKREQYLEYFKTKEYANSSTETNIKVGSRVLHEQFGLGKVLSVLGSGDNTRVSVVFERNNVKQLMLKFAKLKVQN